MYGYPSIINQTACDFSNRNITNYLSHNLSPKRIQETEIVFISDVKDMTFHHYLEQPMSMVQSKMIRRFFEIKDGVDDFEHKWLPDSLREES